MKKRNLNKTGITLTIALFFLLSAGIKANPAGIKTDSLSDNNITRAVNAELLFNATTPSNRINVMTDDGIVTLSGTVQNMLEADRAVKIARTIKGVKGVINMLEVNTPEITDNALGQDVHDALLFDPATDSYEINVEADNGSVTLTGTVDSWQEKQLVMYVVKGVQGVKKVIDQIKVSSPISRSDYEITQEIEQMLDNDVRVDNGLIDVSVKDANVTLSGTLGSNAEKYQAVTDSWVAGVKSVDASGLTVKTWARDERMRKNKYVTKSDEELKNAVLQTLKYDPRVMKFHPDVEVDRGTVTLAGEVDNLKAKRSAESDARNVVGVFGVNNAIQVAPTVIPSDSVIEENIRNALIREAYTDSHNMTVDVSDGIAYLRGTVDTFFEKVEAGDVASRIKGVVSVENRLTDKDNYDFSTGNFYKDWNANEPPYYFNVDHSYKIDEEIKENIEKQLWWSPFVNQDDIIVTVKNGKAILTGTVGTDREKTFAEIKAIEAGARAVQNNLEVNYMQK